MHMIQVWKAANIVWLFVLFNMERFQEDLDLAWYVYALSVAASISVITLGPLRRMPPLVLYGGVIGLLLAFKFAFPVEGIDPGLALTVTEMCILSLTLYLALKVAEGHGMLEDIALRVLAMHDLSSTLSGPAAESEARREMRRARRYERPLAIATIETDRAVLPDSIQAVVDRHQRQLAARFVQGQVADMIAAETKSSDILSLQDGRFRLLLPETDHAAAERLMQRLSLRCLEEFGVSICTNIAAFPEDELTLDGLELRVTPTVDRDDSERPKVEETVAALA